jgi:hypothetical protein
VSYCFPDGFRVGAFLEEACRARRAGGMPDDLFRESRVGMTDVPGAAIRMSGSTSSPVRPGIERSTRITSGWSARACESPSVALRASPTSKRPESDSMTIRRSPRIMSTSSQTRTRIGGSRADAALSTGRIRRGVGNQLLDAQPAALELGELPRNDRPSTFHRCGERGLGLLRPAEL